MIKPLNDAEFTEIVRLTPLVAIDLIVRDPDGKILLGLRNNEPARGFYFVPGGRILKDETIARAFARILQAETGCSAGYEDAGFVGVFEHLYPNNRFGIPDFGTHCVVLAHELQLAKRPQIVLDAQHGAIRWLEPAAILAAADVHPYTKAYFTPAAKQHATQPRSL